MSAGAGLNDDRNGRTLTVLIVEDDAGFAGALAAMLPMAARQAQLRLVNVASVADAAQALKDGRPDAILLDLNVSDSQGIATFQGVKALAPDVPIVILTGVEDFEVATEALSQGAQDWLAKGELDASVVYRSLRYAIERKRLQEQLIRARRVEAIGMLAANVAHEFGNVLAQIAGSTQLLEWADDDSERQAAIREIRRGTERGTSITRQLLGLARNPTEGAGVHRLNELVEIVATTLRSVLPPSIVLDIGEISSRRVWIGPDAFEQVLLNLALNARDAMPEGGTLTLRSRADVFARTDSHRGGSAPALRGQHVVLDVVDTGGGIPDHLRPHIFEPFFTTKGTRGTGLGLALCQDLMREAGGDLLVESEERQGTRVSMMIPAQAPLSNGAHHLEA